MSSFRTPQSTKTSSRLSQSSAQRSLKMSDLSSSHHGGNDSFISSIMNRQTDDSEFINQLAASNAEIDNTRYDIQVLMTKAHAYCKNSGLGNTSMQLSTTPPRYSGSHTPRQSKFPVTPTHSGEFFRSSVYHTTSHETNV